jgi:carbon storage regulator
VALAMRRWRPAVPWETDGVLVITRRASESVHIGQDVIVTVLSVNGDQVRIGIDAPRSLRVLRHEVLLAVTEANRAAASPSDDALAALADFRWPESGDRRQSDRRQGREE